MRKDSMRRVKMNGVLMVNLQVKKFWLTLILCCKFVGFPQVRQLWNLRRLSIGEVITICPKLQAIRYISKIIHVSVKDSKYWNYFPCQEAMA